MGGMRQNRTVWLFGDTYLGKPKNDASWATNSSIKHMPRQSLGKEAAPLSIIGIIAAANSYIQTPCLSCLPDQ